MQRRAIATILMLAGCLLAAALYRDDLRRRLVASGVSSLSWPEEALRYEVRYESHVQFRDLLRDGARRALISSASLQLVLWRDQSSGEVRATIDDLEASTSIDGQTEPGSSFRIPRLGLAGVLGRRGEVLRLDFPESASEGARHLLRTLIAAAQLNLPEGGTIVPGVQWSAEEATPEGLSRARYHALALDAAQDGQSFQPVVELAAGDGDGLVIDKAFGNDAWKGATRVLVQHGRIVAADVRFASTRPETAGESKVTVRMMASGPVPREFDLPSDRRRSSELTGRDDRQRHERQQLMELAGDATVSSLTAELASLADASLRDRQRVLERLAALLRLDPRLSAEAAQTLRGLDPLGAVFNGVAATLTSIGGGASEAALREMVHEFHNQPRPLKQLLPNLAMVPAPSVETESAIRLLADGHADPSIRRTATLALGTVAHQLRAGQLERSEAIVADLGARLRDASTPLELEMAIRALGNAGVEAQLPMLEPLLESEDAAVRALATDALRFVEGDGALGLLADQLVDADEVVRLRAAEALSYAAPRPAALPIYAERLRREASVGVIRALLDALGRLARTLPEARRELEEFVGRCAHPDVCPYAGQILAGLRL